MSKNNGWNVVSVSNEIYELEEKLRKAKQDLHALPGYYFVERALVLFQDSMISIKTEADFLVDEINERDYPMDYYMIQEVFQASGLDFTKEHIEKCRPDCQEAIEEEEARWADAMDFGRTGGEQ